MEWIVIKVIDSTKRQYDFIYEDNSKSEIKVFSSYSLARSFALDNLGVDKSLVAPLINNIDRFLTISVSKEI